MGHSPIDLHTHDMLVFFLNLVVGPELAPPVHVYSSLPVLYNTENIYIYISVHYQLHREVIFQRPFTKREYKYLNCLNLKLQPLIRLKKTPFFGGLFGLV